MQVSTKEVVTSRPPKFLNLRPIFASDGRVGCLATLVRACRCYPSLTSHATVADHAPFRRLCDGKGQSPLHVSGLRGLTYCNM